MEYLLTGAEHEKITALHTLPTKPGRQEALTMIRDMRQSLISLENAIKKF
jgi:hypothetical protein